MQDISRDRSMYSMWHMIRRSQFDTQWMDGCLTMNYRPPSLTNYSVTRTSMHFHSSSLSPISPQLVVRCVSPTLSQTESSGTTTEVRTIYSNGSPERRNRWNRHLMFCLVFLLLFVSLDSLVMSQTMIYCRQSINCPFDQHANGCVVQAPNTNRRPLSECHSRCLTTIDYGSL